MKKIEISLESVLFWLLVAAYGIGVYACVYIGKEMFAQLTALVWRL